MSAWQLGLAVALLVLLAIGWLLRSRAGRGGRGGAQAREGGRERQDRIDTLIGWPPQATRLLSPIERRAFALLTRALPDHMVLAQVPISRFVTVPKRNSYADWLRRVGYQCVDLVVCDRASEVIAVIELRPAQSTERAKKRLDRIARTLKAAQLPLHVWPEAALPAQDSIRAALLRHGGDPAPLPAGATTGTGAAAAARPSPSAIDEGLPWNEGEADAPGLPEPGTTWFDELDSAKGPLSRR